MSMENAILEHASALRELSAAIKSMNAGRAAALAFSVQPLVDREDAAVKDFVQEMAGDKYEVVNTRMSKPSEKHTEEMKAEREAKKNVQAEPTPAEPAAQTTSDPVAPSDELEAAVTKVEEAARAEAAPLDYAKDVKPVLLALVKAKQKPALVDLLAKYNAKNGEQIKADDFAAIVADANALIAA